MSEQPAENDAPAETREDDQRWTTNSSLTSAPSVSAGHYHVTEWRPSVLDAEPINGAGGCLKCPCEWRA